MGEFLVISAAVASGCAALVTALSRFHEKQGAEAGALLVSSAVRAVRRQFAEEHRALEAVCVQGRFGEAATCLTILILERSALIEAVRQRARTYGVRSTAALSPFMFHSGHLRLLATVASIVHALAWTPAQSLAVRLTVVSSGFARLSHDSGRLAGGANELRGARLDLEGLSAALLEAMAAVDEGSVADGA